MVGFKLCFPLLKLASTQSLQDKKNIPSRDSRVRWVRRDRSQHPHRPPQEIKRPHCRPGIGACPERTHLSVHGESAEVPDRPVPSPLPLSAASLWYFTAYLVLVLCLPIGIFSVAAGRNAVVLDLAVRVLIFARSTSLRRVLVFVRSTSLFGFGARSHGLFRKRCF